MNENYQYEEALFNLQRDPGERYDVKEYYPELMATLRKLAGEARTDLGDDLQKINGSGRRN